ncbi:cell division protein FtsQ [Meridianimarinicoccus roseus]|jgi:cell division protein FtsQ|uniref:Cell division protein FtsQ n=1 Tax=Meridianimarinicoccus roseus TaxID=2072018 RepID=A0A2V2LDU0_9RHOB|nr:cell division protein FtsQ/DivIB [Meridianimarinicoccus roseus]PWR01674.1 cell division protein FtsQ [Meridianimarinicoccus roseus]
MRTLIRSRREDRAAAPHDPAPSRLQYRLNRMWLSPLVRALVTRVLPVCLLLAALGVWGSRPAQIATMTGWVAEIRASIEARPEFQIRQMAVSGASPVLADAIRARVGLDFPVSWFDLDPAAIRDDLVRLDAIARVEVTVELGGALRVAVTEREPAIVWRRDSGLELLDASGHRVAFIDRRDGRADLPLITGRGGDAAVPEALRLFEAAAPLGARLVALKRQGERRWDMVLLDGPVIQLPETNARAALDRMMAMETAMDLLARDITTVDLRNPDRPSVRLGPEAMEYLQMTRDFTQGLATR